MEFKRFRPENEDCTAYRLLCPRHVIALEADTYEDNKRHTFPNQNPSRATPPVARHGVSQFPKLKIGRKYLVPADELDRWVHANCAAEAAEKD